MKEFTETDPTKWKALMEQIAPDATIIIPTKTGIIAFDDLIEYNAWKEKQ